MSVITFKYLRELQKKEKESNKLQKIDSDFHDLIREYLTRKKKMTERDAKNDFIEEKKLENTISIIRYIFDRRIKKIINSAASSEMKLENLLPEEERLFEEVRESIEKGKAKIDELIKNREKHKKKEIKSLKLKMLCDLPVFMGDDLKEYGPFKVNDVSEIPKKTAEILVKNKNAVISDEGS